MHIADEAQQRKKQVVEPDWLPEQMCQRYQKEYQNNLNIMHLQQCTRTLSRNGRICSHFGCCLEPC